MIFGHRLAFDRFIKAHPPSRWVRPASRELASAYEGVLPAGLIELWRRKGLGFYGYHQLALVDPRQWQVILDNWMHAEPLTARRIPIALTSFGTLLFYRRLADRAGDIGYVDPVSNKRGVLTSSVEAFFLEYLCDPQKFERLIPFPLVRAARQQCGSLAVGEIYCAEQVLLSMQILQIEKVSAIDMHYCIRDAGDPPETAGQKPAAVTEAFPAESRPVFADIAPNMGCGRSYADQLCSREGIVC